MVDEQPVVLFHKSGTALSPDGSHDWPAILSQLNCGQVAELCDPDWQWSSEPAMNFNCHALAIGARAGIRPSDWLEGIASDATLNENPTEILLNRYFKQLRVEEADHAGSFFEVEENDVVVLCDSRSQHFIHSAIIKLVDGETVAVSKFGEGPILATSFDLLTRFYRGQFDEVHWYRYDTPVVSSERREADLAIAC